MKWTILTIMLTAFTTFVLAEGDVFIMTDDNYEETLKNNAIVMVKFFAPWCGHCKSFAPEYEKAAKMAKEDGKPYIIAELDATIHKRFAEKEGIQGFPTVKLYINGNPIDFNGDRTAESVISFIDKKTSPPSTELKTVDEVKARKDAKGLHCILASMDEKVLTKYVEIATTIEDYNYFHAPLDLVKQVFPGVAENNLVVLKDFDEGMVIYNGEINQENLNEFLQIHMIPTVTEVTQKVIEQVFRGNARKGVFLFRSGEASNKKKIEDEYMKIAIAYKSKDYIFVQTDINEGWGQRVASFFGINEGDLPLLEIIDMKEEVLRYRHSGNLIESEMKKFMEDYKKELIPRFLKSDKVPDENPGPVYTIVGKTFKQEVLDNDDDVIVKFYAPWCGHCKKLEPVFKALAESLSENQKLKFTEVDSTKNDIEGHPIHGFPVIKLFPGKDKSNVHTYNGDRSEGDIARFIKEKSSHPVNIPELTPKDEGEKNKDDL